MSHAEYIMLRNIKVVDLWRMSPGVRIVVASPVFPKKA